MFFVTTYAILKNVFFTTTLRVAKIFVYLAKKYIFVKNLFFATTLLVAKTFIFLTTTFIVKNPFFTTLLVTLQEYRH